MSVPKILMIRWENKLAIVHNELSDEQVSGFKNVAGFVKRKTMVSVHVREMFCKNPSDVCHAPKIIIQGFCLPEKQ